MNKHILKILFFVVSVLFISLAYYSESKFFQENDKKIDVNRFQQTLHKKETELNKILKNLGKKLQNSDFSEFIAGDNPLINLKELNDKGFSVFVYKNDSLRFWSDNSVDVTEQYSISELQQKVINSNNGWYVVCSQKVDSLNLVGLILIKNQYSFRNDFLKNKFHKDFQLPASVNMSYISLSYSADIYDKDKNFMFALVPQNTTTINIPYSKLIELAYFVGFVFILMFIFRLAGGNRLILLTVSILLIVARYYMTGYKYPFFIYKLPIFNPDLFAHSAFLP